MTGKSFPLARLLSACAMLLAIGAAAPASQKPKIGQPAPPAQFTLVDGTKVTLAELRGQVVVINFWATWCTPCRTELPLLDTYYKLQKSHGLRVIAVTTEGSVPLYKMRELFSILTIDSARRIKGPYGPIERSVPTNFIVDRAGTLRYARGGAFTLEALNRELVPLLREPAPPPLPVPAQ
jgi:thiol-disulfide isomerase/thioredoxin